MIRTARNRITDHQIGNMNNVNHLPTPSDKEAYDEISVRPDNANEIKLPLPVHFSLAGIEKEGNFAEVVNGYC